MITVKIEMWPGGLVDHAFEIGRTYICNVSNLAPISNYRGVICRRGKYDPPLEAMERPTRKFEVREYPRAKLNVWRLITRALLDAFPEERKRVVQEDQATIRRIAKALGLTPKASEEQILAAISQLSHPGE